MQVIDICKAVRPNLQLKRARFSALVPPSDRHALLVLPNKRGLT
jgi:hypothetical protein